MDRVKIIKGIMTLIKLYTKSFVAGLIIGVGLTSSFIEGTKMSSANSFSQNALIALTLAFDMFWIGRGAEWLFHLHGQRKD